MTTPSQRLIALAKRRGVIRPEDLRAQAIAPVYLTRLVRSGMLVRVGRGLYSLAVGTPTADRTIVEAARHVPRGVVCLHGKAKTVADCFKFRNKIGVDVAAEALRDYRRRRGSVDELMQYAEVCRVARVLRPFLEALS